MRKAVSFISEYLLLFGLAAFIGWVYEIACVYVLYREYFDRGVLHLPMCPIYGFGILFLMFIFRKTKNVSIIYFGSTLITTVIELAASYVIEYFMHDTLWDYSDWALDYQGRISLISSTMFGLMAVLFLKLVRPPVRKAFRSKARPFLVAFTLVLACFCVCWELRFRLY